MNLREITGLEALKKVPAEQLNELCDDLRQAMLTRTAAHGGHVGPNLGFLEAHDLAGKRIVSFFTSGGSGEGKTLDYLKPSAPKATFETPKNLTHADESAIRTWV